MSSVRTTASIVLTVLLVSPGLSLSQEVTTPGAPQRYKLTVIQNASSAKRVKKNRVSAEAVVEVTDQNNVPVPGIAVSFTIPQLVGGASFTSGGLSSVATTNAAGVASSGSFVAGSNSSFSISAVASVPGGTVTATIPVNAAALFGAAAAGGAGGAAAGGISTGLLVGIIAGAGVAAGVIAKVATGGKGSTTPSTTTSIGLGGASVGH